MSLNISWVILIYLVLRETPNNDYNFEQSPILARVIPLKLNL